MINGNVNEFVNGLYYGDERVFLYRGQKFFIQGLTFDGCNHLLLDRWEPPADDYFWERESPRGSYAVEEFLSAPIWDGKTFWQAEQEMEWVDC